MKYAEITKAVIGAGMKVHSALGNGFQEIIYHRALEIEMPKWKQEFKREFSMPVFYDDIQIGERRVDFLFEGIISVELKAQEILEPVHFAQARNYLEAYNLEVGLLLNVGASSLQYKRLENTKFKPDRVIHSSVESQKSPVRQ